MKYCKKCLQPDTRPGIKFDENQICYACKYEDKKNKYIDWTKREAELKEIADWAKKEANKRNTYDAVIGVSGGKDSTFQAIYAKEKLGLNVLLVNSTPDCITEIGRHNLDNLANWGFDLIQMRPNPKICKKLAKESFYRFGNIVKPSEYCLWASAYIIADKFNIPLIIQGENAVQTLGTANTAQEDNSDAFGVVNLNTLAGCRAKDLCFDDITLKDLFMYEFPDIEKCRAKGIRAIYLQSYAKEWSQIKNASFSIARGLWCRDREDLHDLGRYRRYNSLDSDFALVNQMIKYYKFGFGITTDEACYDIREGYLTREDAIWLINEYDGKCGEQYIEQFCKYINITKDEFWNVVDTFVNKKLFTKLGQGIYKKNFTVGEDFNEHNI